MKNISASKSFVVICGAAAALLISFGAKRLLSNASLNGGASFLFKDSSPSFSTSGTVRETRAPKSETATFKRAVSATSEAGEPSSEAAFAPPVEKKDYSVFEDCAFLGDSRLIALKNYGLVKNVYGVVGLTVDTVFTKSAAGSDIPVIDELNGKSFKRIYLMFGDNECGWPNVNAFIKKYAKVIDAAQKKVPGAEIYLQSVLPISAKASDKNEFGCNNGVINNLNENIKRLADEKGVSYVEPARALKNSDGALPPEAASDGVHLRKKACVIWLNYLVDNF